MAQLVALLRPLRAEVTTVSDSRLWSTSTPTTNMSLAEAAETMDQSFESETVVTSALKGLSNATSWAIGKFYAGESCV